MKGEQTTEEVESSKESGLGKTNSTHVEIMQKGVCSGFEAAAGFQIGSYPAFRRPLQTSHADPLWGDCPDSSAGRFGKNTRCSLNNGRLFEDQFPREGAFSVQADE